MVAMPLAHAGHRLDVLSPSRGETPHSTWVSPADYERRRTRAPDYLKRPPRPLTFTDISRTCAVAGRSRSPSRQWAWEEDRKLELESHAPAFSPIFPDQDGVRERREMVSRLTRNRVDRHRPCGSSTH